jgi:adenylylsulfate kinase
VGKTTVAHRVRERLTEAGLSFEIVGSDAFARRTYERIYDRVRSSSADWILDGTFHERKWFDRFRRFDERGVHVIYREFDAPDADLTIDTEDAPIEDTAKRVANAIARWHDERSTSTDR